MPALFAYRSRYAWAIPDDRALRVCAHFSPLVEIGAGGGYWAQQLRLRGATVHAFDVCVPKKKKNKGKGGLSVPPSRSPVLHGGPDVLKKPKYRDCALLLCYPDETMELAEACLKVFTGDTIIHVGELAMDGTLSLEQAPWGRTTTQSAQEKLLMQFHCILRVKLPQWPMGRDTLTVWRRSTTCPLLVEADEEEDESEGGNDTDDDEKLRDSEGDDTGNTWHAEQNTEVQWWRHIPLDERLPEDAAAPCVAHLL